MKSSITNSQDFPLRHELDKADELLDTDPELASEHFEKILRRSKNRSPRALYGKARAMDILADKNRSNKFLEKAISTYEAVIDLGESVPVDLYLRAGYRCVERMQFRGWSNKAIPLLKTMIKRLPHQLDLLNKLGTQFLLIGQKKAASEMFEAVLLQQPLNNYAAKHLGFILKTSGKNEDLPRGVDLLLQGVQGDPDPPEGKFYYHLGEGLRRLGREEEANMMYHSGVEKGLFLSFWQRSLYNVDHLKGQPVWTKEETGESQGLNLLEKYWESVRDEALALLKDNQQGFEPEAENLQDKGDWKQFELYRQGRRLSGCDKAPNTCALIEQIPSIRTNKRGQVKFSVMYPGTHVHPHSGPTNCRLRAHLGLKVPKGDLKIRVAKETLEWREGKIFVFDDSFDHEVWHNGDAERVVLIVDLWHPELDEETKKYLPAI